MRKHLLLPACFVLSACFTGAQDFAKPMKPETWTSTQAAFSEVVEEESLKAWWEKFKDPLLNELVQLALSHSPDRLMAEAKIMEARGLRKSTRSALFPHIGASASAGREDTGFAGTSVDDFYDARFDASFEVDVFGRNRKNAGAADSALEAAELGYHDVSLTLIAEVVRTYVDLRASQHQIRIADKNLKSQEKTLELISDLHRLGEAPKLDVERAENLVSTTRASLPEFQRQAENARLRLSVLVGLMPDTLGPIVANDAPIPGSNVAPVLMAPAKVLALRPDILSAAANLEASTALAEAATADFFPTFTLGGFFGVTESAMVNPASIWNVALGAAVSILDFGRIEGLIDASRAREQHAFQHYRKTVLIAVTEVETALTDYAYISEQTISLNKAYESATKALEFSQTLYKEGEISFLDVLDAQRNANSAEAAVIDATAAQAESLIRLFKSLGIY